MDKDAKKQKKMFTPSELLLVIENDISELIMAQLSIFDRNGWGVLSLQFSSRKSLKNFQKYAKVTFGTWKKITFAIDYWRSRIFAGDLEIAKPNQTN